MSRTHPIAPADFRAQRRPDRLQSNAKAKAKAKAKRRAKTQVVRRSAGRAGLLASIAMAFLGMGVGALASFVGGHASQSAAFPDYDPAGLPRVAFDRVAQTDRPLLRETVRQESPLRDGAFGYGSAGEVRFKELRKRARAHGPNPDVAAPAVPPSPSSSERQDGQGYAVPGTARPRIAIVFDDVGLDAGVFETLLALPGPVTHSFLAYAPDIEAMAPRAAALGNGVLLHLPMEPEGPEDPGPHALTTGASPSAFRRDLAWNLDRLQTYSGVNNHMGSRLTADPARMTAVMRALRERKVYFLDSVTSARTVGAQVAARTGTLYLRRDVFLDPEAGRETVRRQLAEAEAVARRSGYAIAIAHPRPDTIAVLGPWLASARARGFDLVTTDDLVATLYDLSPTLRQGERSSKAAQVPEERARVNRAALRG
ncbi:MAG: divergent polysaccharide deacetylase family protein [Pseudomonadota bacterium]